MIAPLAKFIDWSVLPIGYALPLFLKRNDAIQQEITEETEKLAEDFRGSGRSLSGHYSVTALCAWKRVPCLVSWPLFALFPPVELHGYG